MKALIVGAIAVIIAMAAAPMIGRHGQATPAAGPVINEYAAVATISTGAAVDLQVHVPREGLTLVEFTADF